MRRVVVDERIREAKRKVSSVGFGLYQIGLTAILYYRICILNEEFAQYGDIFILYIATSVFVCLGSVLRGVELFNGRNIFRWLVPLITAATILIVNLVSGKTVTFVHGAATFAVSFSGAFLILWLFTLLFKKWEQKNL